MLNHVSTRGPWQRLTCCTGLSEKVWNTCDGKQKHSGNRGYREPSIRICRLRYKDLIDQWFDQPSLLACRASRSPSVPRHNTSTSTHPAWCDQHLELMGRAFLVRCVWSLYVRFLYHTRWCKHRDRPLASLWTRHASMYLPKNTPHLSCTRYPGYF